MFQVFLGQPEVIFWPIALEADQDFWLLMWANQSVGENIFYLELFLSLHQLWGWCLMRGSNLGWEGVVGFQVLHILEWSESGKAWGDLHSDCVSNTLRGPSHLGASFWLGSWRL